MLPIFPNFKKLELNDYQDFRSITSQFLPYSDFNFVSAFSYNVAEEMEISSLNNNLVMKFTDYLDTDKKFFSFIGKNQIIETVRSLIKTSKEQYLGSKISLIPEGCIKDYLEQIQQEFNYSEDSNNHDYICSTSEWSSLDNYKDLAKEVRRFESLYENFEHTRLDLHDSNTVQIIFKLFDIWTQNCAQTQEECEIEKKAIERFISLKDTCPTFCYGVYVDEQLIEFEFAEIDQYHPEYAISHFAKFNKFYKNSNVFAFHKLCEALLKQNCQYINIEQDLGFERLRHTKQKWQPIFFLKKYSIFEKS